jgi:hypothetical protein
MPATATSPAMCFCKSGYSNPTYEVTVGAGTDQFVPPIEVVLTKPATFIASLFVDFLNNAARPWFGVATFSITLDRSASTAALWATLSCNVNFSLTLVQGDNLLGLDDLAIGASTGSSIPVMGSWAPHVLETQPAGTLVAPAQSTRAIIGGGAVSPSLWHTMHNVTALCSSADIIRLSEVLSLHAGVFNGCSIDQDTYVHFDPPVITSGGIQVWTVNFTVSE